MVDGNMMSRELEFRGISRSDLEMYFEELGGKRRQSDSDSDNDNAINIASVNASDSPIDIAIDNDIAFDSARANSSPESDGFPAVFVGDGWQGQILREEEISFTTVIKVNAVHVRFLAADEAGLDELIKKYRLKTTRVGG